MSRRRARRVSFAGMEVVAPPPPRAKKFGIAEMPVLDAEAMPPGVSFVKRYVTAGDLVECSHAMAYRTGGRCRWCRGESRFTKEFALPVKRLVKINGDPTTQGALF